MKKSLTKITIGLLLLLAACNFVSCGYEPVFYGIMHDVVPEAATVNGNITSIARCTIGSEEYLMLSGGDSLKYKKLDSAVHGEWTSAKIKLPFKPHHNNYFPTSTEGEGHIGQQILRVLADSSNIYLLTASYKQDNEYGVVLPDTFYLWTTPLATILGETQWQDIAELYKDKDLFGSSVNSSLSQVETDFSLFFTNTIQQQNRKVFLSVNKSGETETSYYLLDGAAEPQEYTASVTGSNFIKLNEESKKANSAFYLGSTLYFSDSLACATNENSEASATFACLAGVSFSKDSEEYNGNSELYIFDGANKSKVKEDGVGSPVASLAFTANSLLIGHGNYSSAYTTNGGISRILLDENGKPLAELADFNNNAKYQFTSSYIVMTLLCADPTKNEEDACLYATISYRGSGNSSSASFDNVGLWSYYPARGNWNRE